MRKFLVLSIVFYAFVFNAGSLKAAVTVDCVVYTAAVVGLCLADDPACTETLLGDFDRSLRNVCTHAMDGVFFSASFEDSNACAVCISPELGSVQAYSKICERKLNGTADSGDTGEGLAVSSCDYQP